MQWNYGSRASPLMYLILAEMKFPQLQNLFRKKTGIFISHLSHLSAVLKIEKKNFLIMEIRLKLIFLNPHFHQPQVQICDVKLFQIWQRFNIKPHKPFVLIMFASC